MTNAIMQYRSGLALKADQCAIFCRRLVEVTLFQISCAMSGEIGGPVVKDRLWFLGCFTPQFFHAERTINHPEVAKTYVSDVRRDYGFLRLDGQVSINLNLFANYTYRSNLL